MNKLLKSALIVVSALALLTACAPSGNDGQIDGAVFSLKATVISVGDKIEVEITEAEYAEGIYWIVYSDKTPVKDSDGSSISVSDLKAGDSVEITYNGQVMMSYPPQIAARKITRIK